MLYYRRTLKSKARFLRSQLTNAEMLLWTRLCRKQLGGIQFYRQKPIGNYIVDFYAPSVKLVIELDGSQHFDEEHKRRDRKRDSYLEKQNLKVLRFDNMQVLQSIESVLQVIFDEIQNFKVLNTPFEKGGR